jgi:hypothetical protein
MERDNKFAHREFHGARFQIADLKFQSTHSMRSARRYDSAEDIE